MMNKAASKETSQPRRVRRARRSTDEVVDRLASAALEEFEAKSFNGATTAAIARRAGVAEALLFTHFGSKAGLFQDTIFKPLEQHFDAFEAGQSIQPGNIDDIRAGSRQYVDALQDFVTEHRGLFLSLVFAQTYKPNGIEGLAEIKGLHDYFARMSSLAERNLKGEAKILPRHVARISFATIIACTLFHDWLFTDEVDAPDEVQKAISDFILEGVAANGV